MQQSADKLLALLWGDDFDTWAIGHKDRIHLDIDDYFDAEGATAIFRIFTQQLLRGVQWFGLNILTLLGACPKLYATRPFMDILADSNNCPKWVIVPLPNVALYCRLK